MELKTLIRKINPSNKCANYQIDISHKKNGEKYMKKCSVSLIIREMQIKTKMSHHLTPVGIGNIKKTVPSKARRKWNPYTFMVGMYKCNLYGKQYENSSKNYK